jgi:hypothetical protein
MSNGNGETEEVRTSWLSAHVRPTLAWFGFFVYCAFLTQIIPTALTDKEWGIVGVLIAPLIAFALWYVGVRSQDKMWDKFMVMTGRGFANRVPQAQIQIPSVFIPPAQQGTPTITTNSTEYATAEEGERPVPFDEPDFLKAVDADVVNKYGVFNACTRLYTAQAKAATFGLLNNRECADLLVELGEDAFKEIWGVNLKEATEHLNDPAGCTTCGDKPSGCTYPDLYFKARHLGMSYYAILRELSRIYANWQNLG